MPGAATAAFVGAAIGGGVALVTGGDPLKGALLGAVGGGIGSVVSGAVGGVAGGVAGGSSAGAVTALLNGGDPLTGALTGGVQGGVSSGFTGGSGSVDNVGADVPDSSTTSAAKQLVDAPTTDAAATASGTTPATASNVSAAEANGYGVNDASAGSGAPSSGAPPLTPVVAGSPGQTGAFDMGGSTVSPGASSTIFDSNGASPPGLIDKVMKAAHDNPQIAAALVTAGGMGVAGAAKGVGDVLATERKAALELENKKKLTEFYRDFIQSGSQGGVGTTLAVKAASSARPLQFTTGGNVYGANGLIGSRV